jgi:phosphinothricin acetyltransferase
MTAEVPIIRPAEVTDLDAIERIYAHYVTATTTTFELEPPDAAAWRDRFGLVSAAGLPFVVAELPAAGWDANGGAGGRTGGGGVVAGYAYCSPWKPRPAYRHTVEDSIYVAPWAGRRGAGGRLLAALLDGCVVAGVREVIAVIADTGDPASVQLHTRHGFLPAGRLTQVGFKHGSWLDTVLLQRSLG